MIEQMTKRIAGQAFDDKKKKEREEKGDDNQDLMPGEDGHGIYNPDQIYEPGMGPNDNYPGKGGAGTYNPDKANEAANVNKTDYS